MSFESMSGVGGVSIAGGPSVIKNKGKGQLPFSQYLKEAIQDTNQLIGESERISNDFAAGRTDDIDKVLIAAEKANIALQYTMQVRNKIMDAYNEIMRMQI